MGKFVTREIVTHTSTYYTYLINAFIKYYLCNLPHLMIFPRAHQESTDPSFPVHDTEAIQGWFGAGLWTSLLSSSIQEPIRCKTTICSACEVDCCIVGNNHDIAADTCIV